MITRLLLLGEAACDSAVDEVLRHRALWTRRGAIEFYTFGAASYLDRGPDYDARAAALNPVLLAQFAPLHAHLRARLAAALDAPVMFADAKAVPGFHIWGVPGIPTEAGASLHFDLQHEHLRWPESARAGADYALSFTLPLRLPRRGGGLSLWDTTYERVTDFYAQSAFRGSLADLLPLFVERVEPYACGELVMHSGHQLHRIAPTPAVDPDDLRITLQGHGRFWDGCWHLYW